MSLKKVLQCKSNNKFRALTPEIGGKVGPIVVGKSVGESVGEIDGDSVGESVGEILKSKKEVG